MLKRVHRKPLLKCGLGYTLIEILIVIFIIAIVTTVGLLSINHNENKQLEAFAQELCEQITLAQEEAMLKPVIIKLIIEGQTYRFWQYQTDDKQKSHWVAFANDLFTPHVIPHDMALSVTYQNNQSQQIVIGTNGDLTPFKIYIAKNGQNPRYMITGEADGSVIKQSIS